MSGSPDKVRTRISFVVEIDAEAWREDYSTDEVIEDAREYLPSVMHEWLQERGVGRVVSG